MNAPVKTNSLSRRDLIKGAAVVVAFSLAPKIPQVIAQGAAASAGRVLDPTQVDAFLAVNADGSVTIYCGKVDLGQGLRIAIPQMAAEELNMPVERIKFVEGDTATTPDQGPTAGSTGIQRGGVQIREAAATARKALIDLGAQLLNRPASDLEIADGHVRAKGGAGLSFAELLAGKQFNLKLDGKAPLKDPAQYTIVGKSLPRPDVPAKVTGTHVYMHDFSTPNMLHARVIRPPAIGAKLVSVDEASIANLRGAKTVRMKDFLAVVAEDEWTALRAQRALKSQWSEGTGLPSHADIVAQMRAGPSRDEQLVSRGDAGFKLAAGAAATAIKGSYYWPMHSHGSIGPSCSVADVRADGAAIWSASQATHRLRNISARVLGIPADKIRVVYLDGAGCYGMNGHDDASVDAILLSRETGRPVRVQWTREDELGWDPKGPPQLLDIAGSVDADGNILDWRTEMWIAEATRGLPNIPLIALDSAGIAQPQGLSTGLISQNGDPAYAVPNMSVMVHWLKETPLRPSNLRAPGKIANCFAVESFFDELAAAARQDPVEMRLKLLKDPRGIEVIKRTAAMMKWQKRASPGPDTKADVMRGRGISYIQYKHQETWLAMGMDVAVERASGRIKVERVYCAHDCGLMINPDGVRAQVEGCILQTLSRAMFEDVTFDRSRVTSVDWGSYPIMTFSDAPALEIDLIQRLNEKPLGAGEAAAAPVGAALANAIFDATGVRLRNVPFTAARMKAALEGRPS